jgi:hypothetical protein
VSYLFSLTVTSVPCKSFPVKISDTHTFLMNEKSLDYLRPFFSESNEVESRSRHRFVQGDRGLLVYFRTIGMGVIKENNEGLEDRH